MGQGDAPHVTSRQRRSAICADQRRSTMTARRSSRRGDGRQASGLPREGLAVGDDAANAGERDVCGEHTGAIGGEPLAP
jgi:hypothetical protein